MHGRVASDAGKNTEGAGTNPGALGTGGRPGGPAEGRGWIGTPLDAAGVSPSNVREIVVEFDEGEEVLTPGQNDRFGAYDLYEAANHIFFISNHIVKGGY